MIPPLGKTVRRIYRHAELYQAGEGWQLCLDGKPLKTPARRLLVIPGRVLAEAAVLEWNAQSERVDPLSMPVNRLANTALDRVAPSRAEVAATAAAYGAADLLCHRAGPEDRALADLQASLWDPWLDWAAAEYGARLTPCAGIMPGRQPDPALAALRHAVAAHDSFALTALHEFTTLTGSLILALALSRDALTPAQAHELAVLDEMRQMDIWGRDMEVLRRLDARRQELMDAAAFLKMHRAQPVQAP